MVLMKQVVCCVVTNEYGKNAHDSLPWYTLITPDTLRVSALVVLINRNVEMLRKNAARALLTHKKGVMLLWARNDKTCVCFKQHM